MRTSLHLIVSIVISTVILVSHPLCSFATHSNHLSRAIELYNDGRYDESFDELTLHIGQDSLCVLAYYYRASIRAKRGEYRLAAVSLKAAFRDSTGFIDAIGLNAYILKQQGRTDEAIGEWKRFLRGIGVKDVVLTVDSILHPEAFHEQHEQFQQGQNEEQLIHQEVPENSQKLGKAEVPQAMPVVDFIESREIAVAEKETPGFKTTLFNSFLYKIKYLFIIVAGFVLLLYLFKTGKYKRRTRKRKKIKTAAATEDVSSRRSFDEEPIVISEGSPEKSGTLSGEVYQKAVRLHEERQHHAKEIKRLLKEL